MSDDIDAFYLSAALALLPEGPVWDDAFRTPGSYGYKLLSAKASAFAEMHRRFDAALLEILPWNARKTLAARETEAGLPDSCTSGRATTLIERRQAVGSRWTGMVYPHTSDGFKALAASLGYQIEVDIQQPFRCGISRCGVDPINPYAAGITMRIRVLGPRKTRFRCGISQIGVDPLLKIQRAEDLECVIRRRAHSHVNVIFAYEGE